MPKLLKYIAHYSYMQIVKGSELRSSGCLKFEIFRIFICISKQRQMEVHSNLALKNFQRNSKATATV